MELILGTTILPEKIIREIIGVVRPPDIPPVNSISFRNKMEGLSHGNFGYFYPNEYKITLCVPRNDGKSALEGHKMHTKKPYRYESKMDFFVAVIAHEYRHAWQWINKRAIFHCKGWIEVDAEEYEEEAKVLWANHLEKLGVFNKAATNG